MNASEPDTADFSADKLREEIRRRVDALTALVGPECVGQDMAAKARDLAHVCLDERLDAALNELARHR